MKAIKKILLTVALLAVPLFSFSQYYQALYDNDSTFDWGWCIKNKSDGNYFIFGWSVNEISNRFAFFNMTIGTDGHTLLNTKRLAQTGMDYGAGYPGQIIQTAGGYVIPMCFQWPNIAYVNSAGGIMKLKPDGDTIFIKTYTDTSLYYDCMNCIGIMPDGGYIAGGERGRNRPFQYPGLVIRTDSAGNGLWTHTYQKDTAQTAVINNVIPLADGRIVLGAMSTYTADAGGIHHSTYHHNTPWFLITDGLGNILKDTLFGNNYLVGSNICNSLYADKNGGYIYLGVYDSLHSEYLTDIESFPTYIAHLDTNFRITWITEFPYSDYYGNQGGVSMRQLQDGSYIVAGETAIHQAPYTMGFAAHISQSGEILWRNNYFSDSTKWAYLRDVVEKPDGNFLFVGSTFNDTLPNWRQGRDMWLLGVDRNGCEIAGCGVAAVKSVTNTVDEPFSMFPNPTTGSITVSTSGTGTFTLYTLLGQQIKEYSVLAGQTSLVLPVNLAVGMYIGKYTANSGGLTKEVRLVYQP